MRSSSPGDGTVKEHVTGFGYVKAVIYNVIVRSSIEVYALKLSLHHSGGNKSYDKPDNKCDNYTPSPRKRISVKLAIYVIIALADELVKCLGVLSFGQIRSYLLTDRISYVSVDYGVIME